MRLRDINLDKQISQITCQECKLGQSVCYQSEHFYFIGGDNSLTVLDTQQEVVIARLKFEGSVKGICMSVDKKSLVVQADDKIFTWDVGLDERDIIEEFRDAKRMLLSPSIPGKIYAGTMDKNFKEVHQYPDQKCKTKNSFKCEEMVTRIAVNSDDTIAYICCGAQNLYKFNIKEFKTENEKVADLVGNCHDMIIAERSGLEYLYVCGSNNLFQKYDVNTGKRLDELKLL